MASRNEIPEIFEREFLRPVAEVVAARLRKHRGVMSAEVTGVDASGPEDMAFMDIRLAPPANHIILDFKLLPTGTEFADGVSPSSGG